LDAASQTIAEQEKKITDTGELVKAIFARSRTDVFEPNTTPGQIVFIKHDDKNASVYLLLKEVPIEGTLQLQYHVFTQQKTTYSLLRDGDALVNILGFRWGEDVANLTGKYLTVSYIGDPTSQSRHFTTLTIKGDQAYADDVPLPHMYPQFAPK
jgi:hypothetical protein